MPDGVTITIQGFQELNDKLQRLGDAFTADALSQAVTAGALLIQNAAKENAPQKTRTLSRSIHTEVTEADADHAVAQIGTDLVYAAIQEFGGTIVPHGHPYLAIPLTDTAASYGAHDFPGKLHKQGMALCDETGTPQYALAASVTLPAQPYLRPALDEHAQDAADAVGVVLKQLIDQAAG